MLVRQRQDVVVARVPEHADYFPDSIVHFLDTDLANHVRKPRHVQLLALFGLLLPHSAMTLGIFACTLFDQFLFCVNFIQVCLSFVQFANQVPKPVDLDHVSGVVLDTVPQHVEVAVVALDSRLFELLLPFSPYHEASHRALDQGDPVPLSLIQ